MYNENNTLGILSLIFGILSIIFGIISLLSIVGILFGIGGIVCAKESFKVQPGNGLARAGSITSIIGIILSSIIFIACTSCVGCAMLFS